MARYMLSNTADKLQSQVLLLLLQNTICHHKLDCALLNDGGRSAVQARSKPVQLVNHDNKYVGCKALPCMQLEHELV